MKATKEKFDIVASKENKENGEKLSEKKLIGLAIILIVLVTSMMSVYFLWFTDFYENLILSNMKLANNTQVFDSWKKTPVKPLMKVHLFNYTNADRFIANLDKKLRVEDVGPYVYEETTERVNEVFHKNGTITYQENKSLDFRPDLSASPNNLELVNVPSVPVISTINIMRDSNYFVRWSLSKILNTLDSKPFMTLPAHDFLFGYDDQLIEMGKPMGKMLGQPVPEGKFGMLTERVGLLKEKFTIDTGASDINQVRQIEYINGDSMRNVWDDEKCDRISGTDGTMFPVNSTKNGLPIYIYNFKLCRSLPFVFNNSVNFKLYKDNNITVPAFRYIIPKTAFSRPNLRPENECFCKEETTCQMDGLYNASACSFGAPIIHSFPHFLHADPKLLDTIDGLKPDPEHHYSYLDIVPNLGFPLAGISKLQLNVQVRKADGIANLDPLPDYMVLPVFWIDMGIDSLPEDLADMIYLAVFTTAKIENGMKVFSLCCLFASLFALFLWIFFNLYQKSNRRKFNRKPKELKSPTFVQDKLIN